MKKISIDAVAKIKKKNPHALVDSRKKYRKSVQKEFSQCNVLKENLEKLFCAYRKRYRFLIYIHLLTVDVVYLLFSLYIYWWCEITAVKKIIPIIILFIFSSFRLYYHII